MVNWFHIFNTEIICHHKKSLFNTFMCRTAGVIEGVQRERETEIVKLPDILEENVVIM